MIKTSVIIPVYNTVEYLGECLDSVLAQTQKELEIILVDDGSTDGSLELAREYADTHENIILLRQEHQFQGTARNRGLAAARGAYIYFMDSDDLIRPELFVRCYEVCERDGLDFAMFDSEGFVYDTADTSLAVPDDIWDRRTMGIRDGLYSGPEFWNDFYRKHGVLYVCWLLYIRRSYLEERHILYEERTYFEDNDWMLRMYLHARRIRYIPEQLHLHRWRRGSNMLSGFTADLMKGCFRMHTVLIRLLTEETDPEKRRMIEDVLLLNIRRFSRLAEVPDTAEYEAPLFDFLRDCAERADRKETPEEERVIHMAVLSRALRAAEAWKGSFDFSDIRLDPDAALADPRSKRVVIYGAGKMGTAYYELLRIFRDTAEKTVVFADSGRAGDTVRGCPCIAPEEIGAFSPDEIVIGSTKYAEEMKETLARSYTGAALIRPLPSWMRFFI